MSMDPRMRPAAPRQYEEFDPKTSKLSEEGAEMLLVYLPGKLSIPSRLLKISGERLLEGNKWKRFVKESRVPPGCDPKEITAKFEEGVLYVRQPKLITPAEPTPAPTPAPAPAPAPAPEEKEDAQKTREDAKEDKGKELEQEEPRKAEPEADTRNKNEEESRDKREIERKIERVAEGWRSGGGVFKELKKPVNVKILVVVVVAAIALALHIAYINKVCRR